MRFFKRFFPCICLIMLGSNSFSQSTGIGTASPDGSALLELKSTTKGFLIPRMNSLQRTGIVNPAEGLLVYQNDTDTGFYYFSGTVWKRLLDQKNSVGGNLQAGKFVFIRKTNGGDDQLWVANLDGSSPSRVPVPDSIQVSDDACLSPDATVVFFNGENLNNNVQGIYCCSLDGSDLKIVASSGIGFDVEVRTAAGLYNTSGPDTSYAFFSRESLLGQDEIWRINLDGTNERKLVISLPGDYLLNVNNDGGQITVLTGKRKLLFKARSNLAGYSSLFTCSYDGTNVQKIAERVGTSFSGN